MKLGKKKTLGIIAASAVIFGALVSGVGGAVAWFMFNTTANVTAATFSVTALSADVDNVKLYMFDYALTTVGSQETYDYIMPERGKVNRYNFNSEEETFGYEDENQDWVSVEVMNRYDPIDLIISGNTLRDLNCNVVYEVTLESANLTLATMSLDAIKLTGVTKENDDIFLTSCVDFDVFYESDFLDTNPLLVDGEDNPLYYPEYKAKSSVVLTPEEEEYEKLYYKASYLSSLRSTHAHFYGGQSIPNSVSIASNQNVEFVNNTLKVYVNVNFAPSELSQYSNSIYRGSINAICDYGLSFVFAQRAAS